eukprot:gnl/Dysnectes_brevis/5518_a7972_309.p1 GENE.gnl/Dysnectes_brevis/5518_a7972_309~~gnl/Dysnectes_brevis/5518_a7972_309.p1  ORF type:complete len:838 (+),score=233.12 gnl/Dysnectes_brevis/5518_a7972_309:51-2564(+)
MSARSPKAPSRASGGDTSPLPSILDELNSPNAITVLPGRLYYLSVTSEDSLPTEDGVDGSTTPSKFHFFSTDETLVYNPFECDFGPLDLGQMYLYFALLSQKFREKKLQKSIIVHFSGSENHLRANAVALIASFLLIVLKYPPEQAWAPFRTLYPQLIPFRDAGSGPATFGLTVLDVLRGLDHARRANMFQLHRFDLDAYVFYSEVENGDLNWLIDGKLLAFAGPVSRSHPSHAQHPLSPASYIPLFKARGVTAVVRLNDTSTYHTSEFTRRGIHAYDMAFPDGSVPPEALLRRFLTVMAAEPVVALHCHGAGTPILRPDGSTTPVEGIRPGDLVVGKSGAPIRVDKVHSGREPLFQISYKNNGSPLEPVVVTGGHMMHLEYRDPKASSSEETRCFDMSVNDYIACGQSYKKRIGSVSFVRAINTGGPEELTVSIPASKHGHAPFTVQLTQAVAWFVGYWLGDGRSLRAEAFCGDRYPKRQEFLRVLCSRIAPLFPSTHFVETQANPSVKAFGLTDDTGAQKHCAAMRFLCAIGASVEDSHRKRIPVQVCAWPPLLRMAFLAGLHDSDGSPCSDSPALKVTQSRAKDDDPAHWEPVLRQLARTLGCLFSAVPFRARTSTEGGVEVHHRAGSDFYFTFGSNEVIDAFNSIESFKKVRRIPTITGHRPPIEFEIEPLRVGAYHGLELPEGTDRLYVTGNLSVHHNCRAGLGRTGTLAGCYLMWAHNFTAREAIAWIRLCRPGSVLGPQQAYLLQVQKRIRGGGLTKTGSPLAMKTHSLSPGPSSLVAQRQRLGGSTHHHGTTSVKHTTPTSSDRVKKTTVSPYTKRFTRLRPPPRHLKK